MINLLKILAVLLIGSATAVEVVSDCIAEDASVTDLKCDGISISGIYAFSHITFNATESFTLFVNTDPPTMVDKIESKGGDHEMSFTIPAATAESATSFYLECSDWEVEDSIVEVELPKCD